MENNDQVTTVSFQELTHKFVNKRSFLSGFFLAIPMLGEFIYPFYLKGTHSTLTRITSIPLNTTDAKIAVLGKDTVNIIIVLVITLLFGIFFWLFLLGESKMWIVMLLSRAVVGFFGHHFSSKNYVLKLKEIHDDMITRKEKMMHDSLVSNNNPFSTIKVKNESK